MHVENTVKYSKQNLNFETTKNKQLDSEHIKLNNLRIINYHNLITLMFKWNKENN